MKKDTTKFILKGALFVLLVIALMFILNFFYYKEVLSKTIDYRQEISLRNYIDSLEKKEIKYAFFGDSQVRDGINPQYINSSFNFATSAESYIETYYNLNRLVNIEKVEVEYFITQFDQHSFSLLKVDSAHLLPALWRFHAYIPYRDIAELRKESVISVFLRSKFPFIGKGKDFMIEKEITPVYLGWTNKTYANFSQLDRETIAYEKIEQFFEKPKEIDKTSIEYFIKLLQLADENNIKIVLVKTPLTPDYDAALKKKNFSREDYYYTVDKILKRANVEYTILDYYDIYFNYTDFYRDSNHLNHIGAENFTRILSKDLPR